MEINEVLVRPKETEITVKCKKYQFLRENCKFSRTLGFKEDYTQTKQSRSHKNLKIPQNITKIRSFLVMTEF